MYKCQLRVAGELVAVQDSNPTFRRVEVRREENEVTAVPIGSGGDKESVDVELEGEPAEGLSEGLATLFLVLSPGLGKHSLFGNAERPPYNSVSEIEDALERHFKGDDNARHGSRDWEAIVAKVLKGFSHGRFNFQACVNCIEASRWIPSRTSCFAPSTGDDVIFVRILH
jgi:hypothetical protein